MRIKNAAINIEGSEPLESTSYGIRAEDMGFLLDILRKRMYRDPIKALCREVAANARDAHREVGTPERPVEIVMPNDMSKQIVFRDFGPGINPVRMKHVFLNYGASTKRHSNNQQGGFGLGAKTPFAVGDSFSVVTTHRGVCRHYTAYIDSSRAGKMDLKESYQTDKPSGTEIIVPVREENFKEFHNAIVEAVRFWDVRPTIIGAPADFEIPTIPEPLIEGDDWKLFSRSVDSGGYYSGGDIDLTVIVDGIGYQVKSADVQLNMETGWAFELLRRGAHLSFKTGELTLAASRDSIQFDDATREKIIGRLAKLAPFLLEKALIETERKATLLEAERFWLEFCNTMPSVRSALKRRAELAQAEEKKKINPQVTMPVQSPKHVFIDKLVENMPEVSWHGIALRGIDRSRKDGDSVHIKRYTWNDKGRRSTNWKIDSQSSGCVSVNASVRLFDKGELSDSLLKKRIKLLMESSVRDTVVYVLDFRDAETRKRWVEEEHIDLLGMESAESLPMPERKTNGEKRTYNKRTTIACWRYDRSYRNLRGYERNWAPTEVSRHFDSGYYIEVVNKMSENFKTGMLPQHAMHAVCSVLDIEIHAVKTKDIPLLGPGWKRYDSLYDELKKMLDEHPITEINELYESRKFTIGELHGGGQKQALKNSKHPLAIAYMDATRNLEEEIKKFAKFKILHDVLDLAFNITPKEVGKTKLQVAYENLMEHYPLLRWLSGAPVEKIEEYMALLDAKSALDISASVGQAEAPAGEPDDYCVAV